MRRPSSTRAAEGSLDATRLVFESVNFLLLHELYQKLRLVVSRHFLYSLTYDLYDWCDVVPRLELRQRIQIVRQVLIDLELSMVLVSLLLIRLHLWIIFDDWWCHCGLPLHQPMLFKLFFNFESLFFFYLLLDFFDIIISFLGYLFLKFRIFQIVHMFCEADDIVSDGTISAKFLHYFVHFGSVHCFDVARLLLRGHVSKIYHIGTLRGIWIFRMTTSMFFNLLLSILYVYFYLDDFDQQLVCYSFYSLGIHQIFARGS